jgi:hypothetical protein
MLTRRRISMLMNKGAILRTLFRAYRDGTFTKTADEIIKEIKLTDPDFAGELKAVLHDGMEPRTEAPLVFDARCQKGSGKPWIPRREYEKDRTW